MLAIQVCFRVRRMCTCVLYVCTCIFICTRVHVYLSLFICILVYTYTHKHTCAHTHAHAHMHSLSHSLVFFLSFSLCLSLAHTHTHTHTYIHTHTHTHKHTLVYVYSNVYTHIYICMHIHICLHVHKFVELYVITVHFCVLSTCTLDIFFYLSVLSSTEYIGYTCIYANIYAHTLRTHTYTHANTSQPALQKKNQLANRTTAFPPCLLRQEDVMLEAPSSFASDEFFMLTLIVNSTHAAFYQNLELLGVSAMPRPLTDCFNNLEGVILEHAHSVREAC